MINANLLPPEVKDKIAQSKQNRTSLDYVWKTLIILLGLIIIFILSWFYFTNQLDSVQKNLNSKEQLNNSYGALTEKAKTLATRIKSIKLIDSNKNTWSGLISEIQKVMPNGIYLTSVKIDSDPKVRGSITGLAQTKETVSSLRDTLEKSPKFQYVDIESSKTQKNAVTGNDEENFTLSFSLEKGALK